MTEALFEPIATAIAMARNLVPSFEEVNATCADDPFSIKATLPAVLVLILAKEVEDAHAEIGRLEAMVMLAGEPGGTA